MEDRDSVLIVGAIAIVGLIAWAWWSKKGGIPPTGEAGAKAFGISYTYATATGKPNRGETGQVNVKVKNLSAEQYTYSVVVLFGEVNVLGAWTTDPTMSRNISYPGGSDGCAEKTAIFPAGWEGEVGIVYSVPLLATIKVYDVWVMIFYGQTRLAERKFLDVFPVEAYGAAASIGGWGYNFP